MNLLLDFKLFSMNLIHEKGELMSPISGYFHEFETKRSETLPRCFYTFANLRQKRIQPLARFMAIFMNLVLETSVPLSRFLSIFRKDRVNLLLDFWLFRKTFIPERSEHIS